MSSVANLDLPHVRKVELLLGFGQVVVGATLRGVSTRTPVPHAVEGVSSWRSSSTAWRIAVWQHRGRRAWPSPGGEHVGDRDKEEGTLAQP